MTSRNERDGRRSYKTSRSSYRRSLQYYYSTTLRWILQRFPFLSHFCIVLLGLLGPLLTPRLTSVVLVAIHLVFVLCQSRTAFGVWSAWRGVQCFSRRDWHRYWTETSQKQVDNGRRDVLDYRAVQHGIIVPAYKEDVSTLEETLDILASHPLASSNYHICLAFEERESGVISKAKNLVYKYRQRGSFVYIDFSLHPSNIVGESAGKSSNVNWATRFLAHRIPERFRNVTILTIMDADTAFASDYFTSSSIYFSLSTQQDRKRLLFCPPTIFDRNCSEVPIFTRATDIFWSCAGMSGLYESSNCKIPTSAYSVSLGLAEFVGFWDAGPEAIGEDLHFYCKALFETRGNLKVMTIWSPASQCNVVGSGGTGPISHYLSDMKARWTQACRHLWGSLDWGYSWHRVLTGSIGQSPHNAAAYMAVMTNLPHKHTVGDEESDGQSSPDLVFDAAEVVISSSADVSRLPPTYEAHERRTPSPSTSASTTYSTDDTLVDQVPVKFPTPRRFGKTLHLNPLTTVEADEEAAAQEGQHGLNEEAQGLLQTQEEVLVDDHANPLRRRFRILVLLTRLYEAHQMIAHVFLLMFLLTLFPAVVHRNGTVSIWESWGRKCTLEKCILGLTITPFSATSDGIPKDLAPGLQPFWMMPDIIICAISIARTLGALGILATVCQCILHDFYHQEAATIRWTRSDLILAEWKNQGSRGPLPIGYLGLRGRAHAERKWPRALLDFTAIPAGLLYGVLPLLYAQLHHLISNRMNYVVSAKGRNVVIPVSTEVLRRSMDLSGVARRSLNLSRQAQSDRSRNNPRGGASAAGRLFTSTGEEEEILRDDNGIRWSMEMEQRSTTPSRLRCYEEQTPRPTVLPLHH